MRKTPRFNKLTVVSIGRLTSHKLQYAPCIFHRTWICRVTLNAIFLTLGGWTAIQLVTYVESKLQFETTTFYASSYKDISKYNNHRQKVPSSVLLELRNDMGFKQLRFYCYKKTVGVMVHIMTNINPLGEAAVNYFIDDNLISNRPQTCGSYTVLPDDNSTMSEDCSTFGWNGTHADGKWAKYAAKGRARILRPIMRVKSGYKYIFNSYPTRRDCDDSKDGNASLSVGDTWSIFVRWIHNSIWTITLHSTSRENRLRLNPCPSRTGDTEI